MKTTPLLARKPHLTRQRILALAVLSAIATIAQSQTPPPDPNEIKNDGGLSYVGDATRLGVGLSRDFGKTSFRADVQHAFSLTPKSATIGEAWLGDGAGGLKLSYHVGVGDGTGPSVKVSQIRKVFVAVDQNKFDDRKVTFGGGLEQENWFGNIYLSAKASKKRSLGQLVSSSTAQVSGTDAGRPFIEDEITTVTRSLYAEPYKTGLGVRVGHFYTAAALRLTAGLDLERGRGGAKQNSVNVGLEKFFEGSPHSVALNLERYNKSGFNDLGISSNDQGKKSDTRATLMYRYTFGQPFRFDKPYKMVSKTVETVVPAPAPVAGSSAASAPAVTGTTQGAGQVVAQPTTRIERRLVKTTASASNETFFDLDRYVLKPNAKRELDSIAETIKRSNYEGNIRVTGHTCDLASDAYNLRLSKRRADVVRAYLITRGLPADRLLAEGMGESTPRYPNTKTERPKNRRVDIEYVSYVEQMKDVEVKVDPVQTQAAVAAPVAPPPAQPTVRKDVVWEKQYIDQEPAWVRRGLLNPADHKRGVDFYTSSESSTGTTRTNRRFVNRAPVAVADAYRVALGSTTTFDVIVNDTDPDPSETLTIVSVTSPSGGTATVSGNRIVYVANATSLATDTFNYTIRDKDGLTATTTVTVTKFDATPPPPANRPPVAVDDSITTSPGKPVTIDVLANDSDPDKDPLTITITQMPRFGTATVVNGRILYTPGPQFNRDGDLFTYTISDGKGGTATAQVRVICV
jgi:outer membrane protein OmpA-like peptidoglycan-associated protein